MTPWLLFFLPKNSWPWHRGSAKRKREGLASGTSGTQRRVVCVPEVGETHMIRLFLKKKNTNVTFHTETGKKADTSGVFYWREGGRPDAGTSRGRTRDWTRRSLGINYFLPSYSSDGVWRLHSAALSHPPYCSVKIRRWCLNFDKGHSLLR